MAVKLTDTQRALLGAAAQREDHCFSLPEGRRLAAARQAASQLLAAGLAREVRARGEAPVWRREEESGCAFALKLTAAGMKAIAALADDREYDAHPEPQDEVETKAEKDARPSRRNETEIAKEQPSASIAAPRSGTKIDHVVKLLSRPKGATLAALVEATGWLPHTTYAALTGLRRRGYVLKRSRDENASRSVYRLTAPSQPEA